MLKIQKELEVYLHKKMKEQLCGGFVVQPFGTDKYLVVQIMDASDVVWEAQMKPWLENRAGVVCSNYIPQEREVIVVLQPGYSHRNKRWA